MHKDDTENPDAADAAQDNLSSDSEVPTVPRRGSKQQRRTESQSEPCKMCGATEWESDISRGEEYCAACGNVAEMNSIDPGAEWTNHADGTDRSRVGGPAKYSLADKGLNTTISRSDLTSAGLARHGISGKNARDMRRRATIDERTKTRSSRARNLTEAMKFIRDRGNLPRSLVEEAARLYRLAVEANLVAGRSIRGVSAACVYLAAREARLPRRIEDIAENFDMTSEQGLKELKRTIRLVSRRLNMHAITGPEEYLEKFHSDLGLPPKVLGAANQLWQRVGDSMEWQGKKPSGIAGVILYKAAQLQGHARTQSDVCEVAGVSEVTLRGLLRILDALLTRMGEGRYH